MIDKAAILEEAIQMTEPAVRAILNGTVRRYNCFNRNLGVRVMAYVGAEQGPGLITFVVSVEFPKEYTEKEKGGNSA